MKRRILNDDEAKKIKSQLCSIWNITKPYWYPLYPCERSDVISFDSDNYIYCAEKLNSIKRFLKNHGVNNVFEFREDGRSSEIIDFLNYDFWSSEPFFWNNECFWFDDSFDWIIYVCHEGSTTFGGQWLIDRIKNEWADWRENTLYDTKNK